MDCTENMLNLEAFHDIEGKTMAEYIEEKEPPPLKYEEIKPAKSSKKNQIEAFENVSEGYRASFQSLRQSFVQKIK